MRERTSLTKPCCKAYPSSSCWSPAACAISPSTFKAAKSLGIQVCGTDSYKHAAPELTWALIMAATRNLRG
jgi:phosphoglycerate dehydrogenase-like enzyme